MFSNFALAIVNGLEGQGTPARRRKTGHSIVCMIAALLRQAREKPSPLHIHITGELQLTLKWPA
jgi:hypothetical protein